ncbi:hypothetical protein SAMN05892883_2198 [Jatrophihabitans sp. GAS493]|uniref:hypothetical protein n=1 Tax=Jatrophihabitans sp. GAS493 TaxID=1907575 RepID=UPI000BB90AC7|nr:hypothetical protein [Jatrophihabitans sp. GAS493]SOD72880.1 hypothetical protein SAMN05892883_2198 [Jatrophihabitans sp. GAS493]
MTASPLPAPVEDVEHEPLDVDALFPADPALMISPEGDTKGLKELKRTAQDRIDAQDDAS